MKIDVDHIDLEDIYEFMETGSIENAPPELVKYLELLDKTHGMILRIRQFGTRKAVVKHLQLVDKLTWYKANQIYEHAIEYFYRDNAISKSAWRNLYAAGAEDDIAAARLMASSVEDLDRISRMRVRVAKLRQLDVPDPQEIPEAAYAKPVKIYAMDPEFLGEGKINRLELAKHIDGLEGYSLQEKSILKQEAAIERIKLFPDEPQDSRQSER